MDIRRIMICLLILWILILCMPNFAVASTCKYSTSFHNNARYTNDCISITRGSTSNGRLNWYYTTGDVVDSDFTVFNGIVYVGSDDDNIYAINATTGTKMWSYQTGGDVESSPTVANGIAYLGGDHNVYALDARTGRVVWSFLAVMS